MKASMIVMAAAALCFGAGNVTFADHHQEGQAQGGEMPPMGPPAEMKQLDPMNGEYSVKFFYKMDPTSEEWVETAATAELSMVVGGGAQQLLYDGDMMGMPFTGMGLTSYDRATGKFQTTWVDSMGARISMYTGDFEEGKLVVTGEDIGPEGATYQARMTTYNITDSGFDWKYEMSMDGGESFMEGAKATYTKK